MRYASALWGNVKYQALIVEEYETIHQVSHGFTGQHPIRLSGGLWIKAQANSDVNAQTMGFVAEVIDVDNFKLARDGKRIQGSWVAETEYFLDPAVAGQAIPEPATYNIGEVRQSLGWSDAAGWLYIEIDVGDVIGEEIFDPNIVDGLAIDEVNQKITLSQTKGAVVETTYPSDWKNKTPDTVTSSTTNNELNGKHTHALDDIIAAQTVENATVTVDTKGRVTALSAGSAGGGLQVTNVRFEASSIQTINIPLHKTTIYRGHYLVYISVFDNSGIQIDSVSFFITVHREGSTWYRKVAVMSDQTTAFYDYTGWSNVADDWVFYLYVYPYACDYVSSKIVLYESNSQTP